MQSYCQLILFTLFVTCLTCHPQIFETDDFEQSQLGPEENVEATNNRQVFARPSFLKGEIEAQTAQTYASGGRIINREKDKHKEKTVTKAFIHINPEQHVHVYGSIHNHYYNSGEQGSTSPTSSEVQKPKPVQDSVNPQFSQILKQSYEQ